MNIDYKTAKIQRPEYIQRFWKRLEGRSHFPLYFASKDSPLDWRGCLLFSALAYHGRLAKSRATCAKLAEMTGLYRETVPKVVKTLQDHGLLDEDLNVVEPKEPGCFFVLKSKTPMDRSWTDKLVYSWYYNLDGEVDRLSLQPFDMVMTALLVGRKLETTTVSYLATCFGTTRKTVSSSLVRLAEQGLVVKSGPDGISVGYDKFLPDPGMFRQTRKAAESRKDEGVIYPDCLVKAVSEGKIPESYLPKLTEWVQDSSDHLLPYDWTKIIDRCSEEHRSFKAKTGVPYPAVQYIGETAHGIWSLRNSTTVV